MSELVDVNKERAPVVKASVKFVRNMGNFESLHVEIGLEDSVLSGETVNEGFERVFAVVENKLLEKVAEVEKALK